MPRPVDRNKWPSFLAKAREFLENAKAAHAAGRWNASVSGCVHAGILACDTVTVGQNGVRNVAGHDEVLHLLAEAVPASSKGLKEARQRMQRLLKVKYLAEYEDRLLDPTDSARCLQDAERVVAFAETLSAGF